MLQPVHDATNHARTANILDRMPDLVFVQGGFGKTASASQLSSTIQSVLRKHELEKKREYNKRVMEVNLLSLIIAKNVKSRKSNHCEKCKES